MTDRARSGTIRVDAINLVRAPGIPRGFQLTGFGPGVNVIWGPNGSGKSTTARALHSLFWPQHDEDGVTLEASVVFDDASWTVTRDGKRATARRAGQQQSPITFAHLTKETRDRYLLALHDLIRQTDAPFAAQIALEMSGGYDLQAAASRTGFGKSVSANKARAELESARNAHNKLLAEQSRIAGDQDRLSALQHVSDSVGTAVNRRQWLEKVRELAKHQADVDEATERVSRFDPVMGKAQSADAQLIADWEKQEPILRAQIAEHVRERAEIIERRDALGLPDAATVKHEIALLTGRLGELKTSENHLRTTQRDLAAARDHAARLSAGVGSLVAPDLKIEDAIAFVNRYAGALALAQEADRFGAAESIAGTYIPRPDDVPDTYPLQTRLDLLMRWAQAPAPAQASRAAESLRWALLIAAAVIIGEAALLGSYWHEYAFALAIIGLAIALIGLRLRASDSTDDARARIAAEYREQGFPEPAGWTHEAIRSEIHEAIDNLQHANLAHRSHQLWLAIGPNLARRQELAERSSIELTKLEESIGAQLSIDQTAFPMLLHELKALLEASNKVRQLEAGCEHAREALEADLRIVQETFTLSNGLTISDAVTASAALDGLNARLSELTDLNARIESIDAKLDFALAPQLHQIEADRQKLIDRYQGRAIEEIAFLALDCAKWAEAQATLVSRRDQLDLARRNLGDEFDPNDWPTERVEEEIARCRAIEEQAASTNQEIGKITTEIGQAKHSEQVAAALIRIEDARQVLAEKRDEHIRNAIGKLVLDAVRSETRDISLPKVAKRARELFAAFTKGRYELRMGDGQTPAFTAWDTHLATEQALHELSSATRVQLLMAVRMAFVETREPDVRLPMIFDETLANTDDVRADALIDTTLDIAASGRQVFYFTAQLDEVDKWRARAAGAGADIGFINLAEARDDTERKRPPAVTLPPLWIFTVPEPGAQSREEYRRTLAVPHLDLWCEDVDSAHLWYLIADLPELHRLVGRHHVTVWGQVRRYEVRGAAPALALDQASFARIAACAGALWELMALMRIGRGKPVTESVLRATGGLTPAYESACLDLLKLVDGDGTRFVQLLENKKIPGMQKAKIGNVREYFEENGHIVFDECIPTDHIRGRLASHCNELIERGSFSLNEIDRLLAEAFPARETISQLARTEGVQATLLPSGE
jgi:energy-coupling factor transporter ATP-binding protein EcfA2